MGEFGTFDEKYQVKHRQDMFREVVRRFMREELVPQQKAFEEAGQPTREVWRALGKMVCCYQDLYSSDTEWDSVVSTLSNT